MRIDAFNRKVMRSKAVNIHDDILHQLQFERQKRELQLIIARELCEEDLYTIGFYNVVGFSMTSCDFWGRSPHILDFDYIDPEDGMLLPNLLKKRESNLPNSPCNLSREKDYIETAVTFKSGDMLIIACEYILYNK